MTLGEMHFRNALGDVDILASLALDPDEDLAVRFLACQALIRDFPQHCASDTEAAVYLLDADPPPWP